MLKKDLKKEKEELEIRIRELVWDFERKEKKVEELKKELDSVKKERYQFQGRMDMELIILRRRIKELQLRLDLLTLSEKQVGVIHKVNLKEEAEDIVNQVRRDDLEF